jgi:hypothetical protein
MKLLEMVYCFSVSSNMKKQIFNISLRTSARFLLMRSSYEVEAAGLNAVGACEPTRPIPIKFVWMRE